MSAINAIVTPSAAHLIVDGLCYDKGQVTQVDAQKTFTLQGMRAAIAATGDAKTGFSSEPRSKLNLLGLKTWSPPEVSSSWKDSKHLRTGSAAAMRFRTLC